MQVIARKVALLNNLPAAGEKAGGATFAVTFEVKEPYMGDIELTFDVITPDGVSDALLLARQALHAYANELANEAMKGDLGHGERRLY